MKTTMQRVLAGVALLMAQAALTRAGSVTGNVVDAVTGAPIAAARVEIYDCGGRYVTSRRTDETGHYVATDLVAGTYLARTYDAPDHVDQLHRGTECTGPCDVMAGTPFGVTAGATTVDFALKGGGSISGRVTDAAAAPLADVEIVFYEWFGKQVATTRTAADGTYRSVVGLLPGTYYVLARGPSPFVSEAYDGVECAYGRCDVATATPVVVKRGLITSGIDFSLDGGSVITGRVTDEDTGLPVSGTVSFYDSAGRYIGSAPIGAEGGYESPTGLPEGEYTVRPTVTGYCTEAEGAAAGAPGETSMSLSRGGALGGFVQDAEPLGPLAKAWVSLHGSDGRWLRSTSTNAGGWYQFKGLCSGSYYVAARGPSGQGYIRKVYDDVSSPGYTVAGGTPVSVHAPDWAPLVNFRLGKGGHVSGAVFDAVTGLARKGLSVSVFNSAGQSLGSAKTDCHGDGYRAPADEGLPDGEYLVMAEGAAYRPYAYGYRREAYDDADCGSSFGRCVTDLGTPVAVASPDTTSGVSFALVRRDRQNDFDRDGRGNLALHNIASGEWRVRAADGTVTSAALSGHGLPVSADYDGDGKTDLAAYDPTLATWRVRRSSDGTEFTEAIGGASQVPVRGDWDGNSRADVAVYDPATGIWSLRRFAGGPAPVTEEITWGGVGRVPVPADYDGDAKTDIGTYQSSTGAWSIRRARNGAEIAQVFGGPGQQAVPGDFDGDGRADFATFEPATGNWKILHSVTGSLGGFRLGGPRDIPSTLDFDGDGRADAAVYDPGTFSWRIRLSATGATASVGFGFPGFLPQR